MSNRFLTPDNASVNISNGSAIIFGASLGSQNLNSGMPVKTNSLSNLVSSKLDISDVNNLQSSLDSVIRNPYPSTLIVSDLQTDNVVSVDSAITTLQNTAITNPSAVSIEATSFIKTGGTSSEFLKADGSSDSSRFYIAGANLAIGPNSLISNTSGIGNEAIGYGTLKDNTEGNYNNAVGVNALMNNTSGSNNMAIGLVALYTNITGNDNTAIGYRADVNSDNLSNAMALGSNAKVSTSNTIQLGDGNITTVNTSGNITANSFVKNGGTNIQYLMGDGSTLTQSANSGNSNFYLYNSGTSQNPTPPAGFITYNNATQSSATIIYISHKTRDNIDIEVYFKQITTITDVYIQDENTSVNFIQFNVTGTPTITSEAQVAIPVILRTLGPLPGPTNFANGHNVFVSFFTNGLEVDTRLSNLETNTQFQTIVSGNTNFSSGITIGNNYITTTQGVFNASGQLVSKNYVDTAIGIGTNNTTERWVNSYIGVDTNSGSIIKPLQTINAGFSNSAQYPLKLNIRGVFTALQTLTATNSNLQITTTDGYEAQQTTLSATVITSGALTRLKMSGFTITTGGSAVLQFGDTLGRHTFSNMQFVSSNSTPITFNAGFTNWCNFQDCDFGGLSAGGITLPNLGAGTAILRLYNCGVVSLTTGIGWTVYISGSTVLTTSSNLASGTIIQLPFNSFNAVLTSNPTWSALPVGNYINMVAGGLTGVIGTPTLGCCVIKIATGVQIVSLGYNQLPSSINVLNGSNYDTYVRTSGAVGWVVVNQSAYLPLTGGVLTGQVSTNQTPSLSSHLVPKSYVDTFLPKAGGSVSGVIDMGSSGSITSNQTFFAGTNFVTKTYVDNAVSGGGGSYLPLSGGKLLNTGTDNNSAYGRIFNNSGIPIDNDNQTATIYWSNGSISSTNTNFVSQAQFTQINATGLIAQNTSTYLGKIVKYGYAPAFQSSGNYCGLQGVTNSIFSGDTTRRLYIGMGFKAIFSFGVGDTNSATVSTAGMMIGFYSQATQPGGTTALNSFIGIGNNGDDNSISFYVNGSSSGTITGTGFNTTTPDTRWFVLSIYNLPASPDIVMTLTDVINNVNKTIKFTSVNGNTAIPSLTTAFFPFFQRFHGPTLQPAGAGILHINRFTLTLLN